MKRIFLASVLAVIVLLVFATLIVWAAPPLQEREPNFAPTEISLAPEVPYPGQVVEFTITYKNQGEAEAPDGTVVQYRIVAKGVDDPLVEGEDDASGLAVQATREVTGTFYAPAPEDTYVLDVVLVDTDGVEGAISETFVVESALPSGVAQLLAGLGIFAAVMAIMAAGTEVVIESLKFLLGMKQKVTAMEAFDQLKQELPGQLAGLGVDAESRKKINDLVTEVEGTLKPVEDVTAAYQEIKDGHFGAAYDALAQLKDGVVQEKSEEELDRLKKAAKDALEAGLSGLGKQLGLDEAITDGVYKQIGDLIDGVTIDSAKDLLDKAFSALQGMFENPEEVTNWLQARVDTFLVKGRAGVVTFVRESSDALLGLGFQKATVDEWVNDGLVKALDTAEHAARQKTETYSLAVKNLLGAVEDRRNATQSPARKIWRRLRGSHLPLSFALAMVVAVAVVILCIVLAWPLVGSAAGALPGSVNPPVVSLVKLGVGLAVFVVASVVGLLVGVVAWLVMAGGVGFVTWLVKKRSDESLAWLEEAKAQMRLARRKAQLGVDDEPPPSLGSLGHFIQYGIEKGFNDLRGSTQPVELYGEVDVGIREKIEAVGPTTVAQVLLERDDKHRDEEASRIRIMRVFSIIVGTVLAYWLQIDAAVYLNYAVPGIAGKINAVSIGHLPLLPDDITVGIVLTGLAASAGSKFWRDLLGRLQTARGQAEEAAKLVRKVKGMVGAEEG